MAYPDGFTGSFVILNSKSGGFVGSFFIKDNAIGDFLGGFSVHTVLGSIGLRVSGVTSTVYDKMAEFGASEGAED